MKQILTFKSIKFLEITSWILVSNSTLSPFYLYSIHYFGQPDHRQRQNWLNFNTFYADLNLCLHFAIIRIFVLDFITKKLAPNDNSPFELTNWFWFELQAPPYSIEPFTSVVVQKISILSPRNFRCAHPFCFTSLFSPFFFQVTL